MRSPPKPASGKQTIYRHFRSKEALVQALVEAMCAPEVVQPPARALPVRERRGNCC
jgi:TetR/AcrR family transcriptional regulator, mexJK operon transcriptional repressor